MAAWVKRKIWALSPNKIQRSFLLFKILVSDIQDKCSFIQQQIWSIFLGIGGCAMIRLGVAAWCLSLPSPNRSPSIPVRLGLTRPPFVPLRQHVTSFRRKRLDGEQCYWAVGEHKNVAGCAGEQKREASSAVSCCPVNGTWLPKHLTLNHPAIRSQKIRREWSNLILIFRRQLVIDNVWFFLSFEREMNDRHLNVYRYVLDSLARILIGTQRFSEVISSLKPGCDKTSNRFFHSFGQTFSVVI